MRAYIWARTGEELRLLTIKVGMVYVKYKRDETTYCTTVHQLATLRSFNDRVSFRQ